MSVSLAEIANVSISAATACEQHIGKGDQNAADQSAVVAMRTAFKALPIKGRVVIGEGERDSAPMLYIGEKVGAWNEKDEEWDIAVDPLEGTNFCAKGQGGALSVLSMTKKGALFGAPDIYMEKIACGPTAKEVIDLNLSAVDNVKNTARALNKNISEIKVAVLDRPRHKELIQSLYSTGARVMLIEDGDLSTCILTCPRESWKESPLDLVMGTGGAPEGVLSACALKCLGGGFQGRLVFQNDKQKQRASKMGITQLDKVYSIKDMVKGSVIFCATGVTTGALLKGVQRTGATVNTQTLYMDSKTGKCVVFENKRPA